MIPSRLPIGGVVGERDRVRVGVRFWVVEPAEWLLVICVAVWRSTGLAANGTADTATKTMDGYTLYGIFAFFLGAVPTVG